MLLAMENDRFHMETGYTTEEVKRFMEVLQQYALRAQDEENANQAALSAIESRKGTTTTEEVAEK